MTKRAVLEFGFSAGKERFACLSGFGDNAIIRHDLGDPSHGMGFLVNCWYQASSCWSVQIMADLYKAKISVAWTFTHPQSFILSAPRRVPALKLK